MTVYEGKRVRVPGFGVDIWVTDAEWAWMASCRAFEPVGAYCPWPMAPSLADLLGDPHLDTCFSLVTSDAP